MKKATIAAFMAILGISATFISCSGDASNQDNTANEATETITNPPAGSTNRTQLWIENPTTQPIEIFIVLAAEGGACGPDHPPVTADELAKLGWCSGVVESGNPPFAGKCSTTIPAKGTIRFPDIPNTCISGNITYRAFPACPTNEFPLGFTTAEFTLNVASGPEVIDISMVNGYSNEISMTMSGGGTWTVEGTSETISTIRNFAIGSLQPTTDPNIGKPGVYPVNCTDCIQLVGQSVCPGFASSPTCQPSRTCNIQRDVSNGGGKVTISLL